RRHRGQRGPALRQQLLGRLRSELGRRQVSSSTDDRDWIARVEALREQGAINDEEEATLVRHRSERRGGREQSTAALVPECRRRRAADGETAAHDWVAAQAG